MANVLYAFSEGEDINGDVCRVELWGPYRLDAPVEFTAGYPFCFLKWSRNEDEIYTDPFMFGEADINLLLETTAQEAILDGIAQSQENTYSVQIKVDGVRYWTGLVLPDTLTVEIDCNPANINIRASDGWQVLKNYKTFDTSETFGSNFYNIISQLVNWEFFPSSAQSVFFQPQFEVISASNQVFKDCKFERVAENDFEYIKSILNDLGMYLVQTDGYWYIIGLLNVSSGIFNGTWYKEDSLTAVSSTTLNYSTIVLNTDRGGIKKFTRPFAVVESVYDPSKLQSEFSEDITYSPTETFSDHTIINKVVRGKIDVNTVLEVFYTGRFSSPNGGYYYLTQSSVEIKYGNRWYSVPANAWSSSYVEGESSQGIGIEETVGGYYLTGFSSRFDVPIGELEFTDQNLEIQIRFAQIISDGTGVTPVSNNFEIVSFRSILTLKGVSYKTTYLSGTGEPVKKIDSFYNTGNFLNFDDIYSNDLGDYVTDQWSYSAGVGSPTGYLHELRADAIASLITNAETLFEISCDNLNGPASFYRTIKLQKLLPIQIEQDMIRREGKLLALRV